MVSEKVTAETQGLDLRVHIRDAKTGRIVAKQPYRLFIEGGQEKFERPVGSGNFWSRDGRPLGEHKPVTEPTIIPADLQSALAQKELELQALKKQLAAREAMQIKQESEAKAEPNKAQTQGNKK